MLFIIDIKFNFPNPKPNGIYTLRRPKQKSDFRLECNIPKILDLLVFYFSRGLEFRPDYKQICELRGVVKVPWLFLTATCTGSMYQSILQMMGLDSSLVNLTSMVPDRPNIFFQSQVNFTGSVYYMNTNQKLLLN